MSTAEILHDFGVLARALRDVRRDPPMTIGDATKVYADALNAARDRGVDKALLLCVGEIVWNAIRPEHDDEVEDHIGVALDSAWEKHEADLAFCAGGPR